LKPLRRRGVCSGTECQLLRHRTRRRRFDYLVLPPEPAIGPSDAEGSINVAIVLRDQFAQDSTAVRTFFDARVGLLTGSGRKR